MEWAEVGSGNANVLAVAGSGKTTTLVELSKRLKGRCLFLAFNKAIVNELKQRLDNVECRTLNSLGARVLITSLRMGRIPNRTEMKFDPNYLYSLASQICYDERWDMPCLPIVQMVHQAKAFAMHPSFTDETLRDDMPVGMVPSSTMRWRRLMDRVDIDIDAAMLWRVVRIASRVLRESVEGETYNFDDQLYLPVLYDAHYPEYDWILVDEAQDLSPVQLAMIRQIMRPNTRLIAVGDDRQSIYAFRGADSEAMDRIRHTFATQELPLTCSFRCPEAVGRLARKVVPYFQTKEGAIAGRVSMMGENDYKEVALRPSDLVLCRNNAPLLGETLFRMKQGLEVSYKRVADVMIKARKLVSTLNATGEDDAQLFASRLVAWREEAAKAANRRGLFDRARAIEDLYECMMAVLAMERVKDTGDMLMVLSLLVAEQPKEPAPSLSTIHGAKGLEAPRVFLLAPELLPDIETCLTAEDWREVQEQNLLYVAITRAQRELIIVEGAA